jgi:hypothetical protein
VLCTQRNCFHYYRWSTLYKKAHKKVEITTVLCKIAKTALWLETKRDRVLAPSSCSISTLGRRRCARPTAPLSRTDHLGWGGGSTLGRSSIRLERLPYKHRVQRDDSVLPLISRRREAPTRTASTTKQTPPNTSPSSTCHHSHQRQRKESRREAQRGRPADHPAPRHEEAAAALLLLLAATAY